MTGHTPWSQIKHKPRRCKRILPGGEICGKIGSCIHHFQPTLFGAREQVTKEKPLFAENRDQIDLTPA